MTTSHGGRNGRGVSLNLVSRCHSHNPSVVDNYDEHMEEDIAKAMAEFVETDIADNSPVTSTNTTNTSVVETISGSTQSLDMVATSTSTSASSASWMHAQSSQVKESDNRSHSTDAITTALLSSIAASCAPSTTAITSHSQSYTLLSSSVDQLKSTPSTVDSSLLGQNNDGLMNTGTSIVSPTSQHSNNNNRDNNDQSEGTSKTRLFSNSLDLSTITAEQLKEELSLHTLIRLEQEVVKAIQLHGRTHHGEAMDTSQLSARTTNTTLPLAPTNANVPRGRGNGKRTMIPHRHANNGMDTSTNTSTSSMSVSSAGMAASYAKPDIPLVRLLPAPLPVSKSTNYTTGNNQAYRNLKLVTPIVSSPSGLASSSSSSSATMPMNGSNGILSHNSHSDTSVPTRSELAGMDRSKSMSRIPTSTMIHRRIVSPSSMSQSTPILLPSASSYTGISTSASLTNGLMVTSTDMKRIAKRKSELVNSEQDQSLSQPLRARRRLTKSTSDISTVTAKHTNTTTTESVNIISKSLPTITEVPSNSGKGVQRQQNNSNNNNNGNGNGRNNRVIAPSPPATPLGPSIVPPPVGDPHPPRALPATQPITRVVDGVEWIEFSYSVKGANQYYRMRADIDTVDLDAVPIRFKHDNCLYPRADVPLDEYRGNRWRYENECNNLGWRLAWLNREVMSGKRGLLQRAVDSYRNRYRTMRSRRVARLEKMASSSNSSINNGSNSNHGNHGEGNDGTIRKPRKKSTTAMTTTTTTTSSDTKDQQGMKPLINDTTTLNSPTITSSLPLTSVSDIIGTTSLEQLSSHLLIPNTSVEAPSLMNDSLLTQSMASLTAGVLSSDSPMLLANTGTTAMTPTTATESSNIDWSAARSRSARMPKYLVFDAVIKGMSTRVRIRVDPTQKEDVLKHTDDEFRRANALYPRALCPREQYTGMRYDLETRCNQLAFELAALNPARLNGRKALLQKAVDAYRKRFAFDWRPRRGKTALLVRVAAEAAAAVAQQQSPIASKIQLPDTACLSGGSSSSSCNVKEDHSCDTTLPLMSVTPVSTPEPSSLTTVVDVNVMTKTTSTDMTSATIGESTLPGGLDYLQLPTDNAHFESLVLSEVQMLTQKLNSSMSASNVNSVAISPTPSGCLSTNEAQLQALLMDDEHELHDSHNEALLVKQLEEALQRSTQHNQQSHHDSSSGNNSHMSTTVSTPNASNYHQHQHQHHITEHALSAVDLIHALQHQ